MLDRSSFRVFGSVDQSDLVALTRTRVPSLFVAIESDRHTRSRICLKGELDSSGRMRENELSTGMKAGVG